MGFLVVLVGDRVADAFFSAVLPSFPVLAIMVAPRVGAVHVVFVGVVFAIVGGPAVVAIRDAETSGKGRAGRARVNVERDPFAGLDLVDGRDGEAADLEGGDLFSQLSVLLRPSPIPLLSL